MKNSTRLALLIFITFIIITFVSTYGICAVKQNNEFGIWITSVVFCISFSFYILLLNKTLK